MRDDGFKGDVRRYFSKQSEVQGQVVDLLVLIEKQQRALLAVFGAAAKKMAGE